MTRASIEALLVGLVLPATRDEIIAYARAQPGGERALPLLERIPEREYESIQDVGEAIEPVQPARDDPRLRPPVVESGDPPGGPAYVGEPTPPPAVAAARAGDS